MAQELQVNDEDSVNDVDNMILDDREQFLQNMSEPTGQLTEAGAVVFAPFFGTFVDDNGNEATFTINVTCRALNGIMAIDDFMTTVQYAKKEYNMSPLIGDTVKKVTQKEDPFPVSTPAKPATQAKASDEVNWFVATKLGIEPRTDGRSYFKFYGSGHKFPDLSAVLAPDQAVKMMAHLAQWTPEHFMKAVEYDVKYRVGWKNSETLNSKGNPYKNIVAIEQE